MIDFMPPRGRAPDIVRIVEGLSGEVEMRSELVIRLDFGRIVPWVRRVDGARVAIAGPDALCFRTPVETYGENMSTVSDFTVSPGDRVPFVLTWFPSHEPLPDEIDPEQALADTEEYWLSWADGCKHAGDYHDEIHQSLLVLKALTYAPTGGIVAAPTTSLPEHVGGVRNWDYRFCWLRDATLTLLAMLRSGYRDEAIMWRDWLLRAVAGDPADVQIMYGLAGERRLDEYELDWLPGYEGSQPVRVGNAASTQLQLDVYGEVLDALYQARANGAPPNDAAWSLVAEAARVARRRVAARGRGDLGGSRTEPALHALEADGLGRVRPRDPLPRGVRARRAGRPLARPPRRDPRRGLAARLERGEAGLRAVVRLDRPRRERAADAARRLPAGDRPAHGLDRRGDQARADRRGADPSLPAPGRGRRRAAGRRGRVSRLLVLARRASSALQGRHDEARELFERLLDLRNDLGLLSEEYDPHERRQLGNFPQAFTHLSLVNTAFVLSRAAAYATPTESSPCLRFESG